MTLQVSLANLKMIPPPKNNQDFENDPSSTMAAGRRHINPHPPSEVRNAQPPCTNDILRGNFKTKSDMTDFY